ncbi:MAG: hypothetical protein ACREO9_06655, partial [Lysobacterales bacterium]
RIIVDRQIDCRRLMSFFKLFRIIILLSIFFVILVGTWMNQRRLASWDRPIWVTIYPMAANDDMETAKYAKSVDLAAVNDINPFFERNLGFYGVSLTPPIQFQIAPVSTELPPAIPDRHSPLSIALWSLRMRWWSWRMDVNDRLVSADIQVFVLYHALGGKSEMTMSVGMRKGMYGLVKAYASRQANAQNQITIAHELLHVLGATDKYVFATGEPEYPFGYAEPNRRPLFPQARAEIMGGRIPLSAFESVYPKSLADSMIGHETAEEIGLMAQFEKH